MLAPAKAKFRALRMWLELLDPPDRSLPGSLVQDLLAPCASLTNVDISKAAWVLKKKKKKEFGKETRGKAK